MEPIKINDKLIFPTFAQKLPVSKTILTPKIINVHLSPLAHKAGGAFQILSKETESTILALHLILKE